MWAFHMGYLSGGQNGPERTKGLEEMESGFRGWLGQAGLGREAARCCQELVCSLLSWPLAPHQGLRCWKVVTGMGRWAWLGSPVSVFTLVLHWVTYV
jgi:hypothetical protein